MPRKSAAETPTSVRLFRPSAIRANDPPQPAGNDLGYAEQQVEDEGEARGAHRQRVGSTDIRHEYSLVERVE